MFVRAALLTVAVMPGAFVEAQPSPPPAQKPIAVEVGAPSSKTRGALGVLLAIDDDDAAAAERGLSAALRDRDWLAIVADKGDVAVAVSRAHRWQQSRDVSKDGKNCDDVVQVRTHRCHRDRRRARFARSRAPGHPAIPDIRVQDAADRQRGPQRLRAGGQEPRSESPRLDPAAGRGAPAWRPRCRVHARGEVQVAAERRRAGGRRRPARRTGRSRWPPSGDRIRAIGAERGTSEMNELAWLWCLEAPGTRVSLEVERDKQRRSMELELAARR